MTQDAYTNFLLEDMHSQFQAVIEAVSDLRQAVAAQPTREEFNVLVQNVTTTNMALKDMGFQVHDRESRLANLESKRV